MTKPENGREHDAERRHQQRVEQPDQEHAAIGVLLAVGDQRLADAEAGRVVEETEAEAEFWAARLARALIANSTPNQMTAASTTS